MVEKEKAIETLKQKNIQLEEKLKILNRYVEESKKKEMSSSLFDNIPDTQKLNKLTDEIKNLEVNYIFIYIIYIYIYINKLVN